jgi:hypothetical protein
MMTGDNIKITKEELSFIRSLKDFDLTMVLSEIHDHGWPMARKLLPDIMACQGNTSNRSSAIA